MASQTTTIENILKRERWVVIAGLSAIVALAWLWLLAGAGTGMNIWRMTTWSFPPPIKPNMVAEWSLTYALLMLSMWWVMMIAMMTPSAAPVILLFGRVYRHEQGRERIGDGVAPTFVFALGYLTSWLLFSAVATLLQWGLEQVGLVHAMLMWSVEAKFSGLLLVAAGLYQFSPLKHACLRHCRSPAQFLAQHYCAGRIGAWRMGMDHGLYCVGCCWVLMALLFAGGVMNLVWIAGLTIFVLLEKVLPYGHVIARVMGAVLLIAGTAVLAYDGWPS